MKGGVDMPACIRCHKDMPENTPFCPFCGARQEKPAHNAKARGNGTGTAVKYKGGWKARVVVGWRLVDGKKKAITRSKSGFKTKSAALAACKELLHPSNAPTSNITFSALYERWQQVYASRIVPQTMGCYKAAYKHFKQIHYMRFTDIRGDDLQACINACPAGKRTKQNMRSLISLLYKYGMQNDIVTRNRAETLYAGNDPQKKRPAFTWDELEKIRQAIGVLPYADYVYCMCYLGYRPGEMLRVKKTDYDAEHKCFVNGIKTEAGRDRIVTISPKILPLVEARIAAQGIYVFPRLKDNTRMSDNYFRKFCFNPLMEKLGIQNRVPYSARHTFANLLKEVKGSDTDKSALMGHADTAQTKEYQSADYASLKAITDKIGPPKSGAQSKAK